MFLLWENHAVEWISRLLETWKIDERTLIFYHKPYRKQEKTKTRRKNLKKNFEKWEGICFSKKGQHANLGSSMCGNKFLKSEVLHTLLQYRLQNLQSTCSRNTKCIIHIQNINGELILWKTKPKIPQKNIFK